MPEYIHGTETIEIVSNIRTVSEVRTAVIGLVGIAPVGPKNLLTLVTNETLAAQFGKPLPGFSIPQALSAIMAQGAGTILVINVFDEAIHTVTVSDELKTVADGRLKLDYAPLTIPTLKDAENEASDYISGTDYTIDEYGNFLVIKGRIPNATVLKFTYKRLNRTLVTPAHVIGTVGSDGLRTGIKAFDLSFNKFGFKPKILIAPVFSEIDAVAEEFAVSANKSRSVYILDGEYGATVQEIIEARGDDSNFDRSDQRAILLFPYLKAYDIATDSIQDVPFSAYYAGVMARTDRDRGYWFSPSNKEIRGVSGVSREISASLNDPSADTNILNAAGIVTVFNSFGTGLLAWGNRNASYPTNTLPNNFISLRRIADVVYDSLEQSFLPFVDEPITQALVDDMRQSGNNFMKVLVGRGALIEGSKVVFDIADNPSTDLANGKIKFRLIFMGATPAETISFLAELDASLYSILK